MDTRQALSLCQKWGLCVTPIAYKDKKPLVEWKQYQARKPDHDEMVEWWGKYWLNGSQANMGIVCGKVSDNLVVLDFDNGRTFADFVKAWEARRGLGIYEETPVVATARGFHVYLRTAEATPSGKLDGVDIQSEGKYVVAPPSVHPGGTTYEFINPEVSDILQISSLEAVGIEAQHVKPSPAIVEGEAITQGQRNATLTSMAGAMRRKGFAESAILAALFETNSRQCSPPLPEGEVKAIASSVARYQPAQEPHAAQADTEPQRQYSDIVETLAFDLDSFLGRYLDYATHLTDAPKPFHLAAGLTALAACCGSNVTFPGFGGRTYWPNIYALSIAPSGLFRKSTALGIAQDLISEVDRDLLAPGEETRERFIMGLKERPSVFYPISEFAAVLSLWQREYMNGMREIIVDLYDPHEQYVRQTMKEKIIVKRPAVNILAATTIDWLREKLSEGDLRGGLMGRFLLFPGQHKEGSKGLIVDQRKEDKAWLIGFLKDIHAMSSAWVDVSHVRDGFDAWLADVERRIESAVNPDLIGFQSRIGNHALKLLTLISVSQCGVQSKYQPSANELDRATTLAVWLMEQAEQLAMTGFTKNKTEQQVQKLIGLAARKGGIDRATALRLMHTSSKEFDLLVGTTVDRGQIRIEKEKQSGNRTRTVYRLQIESSQSG